MNYFIKFLVLICFFTNLEAKDNPVQYRSLFGRSISQLPDALETKKLINTSASETAFHYTLTFNKINFDLGASIKNNILTYISTTDTNFMVDDSIRVGKTLSYIKKTGNDKIQYEYGWGHFIKLKSGWCVGFDYKYDSRELTDNDTVAYIYFTR